ncbi:Ribosomal protein S12p Asp88 methylthiotransferase [Paramagnetospirillum magnetotacticum MS-1]|uniref:Ribosomal protein uS12 methylthiotransferase RimO n=1 Tax=Paramagnetospirillum magnetotacticum MS-1 TaxID=272627 RepID=A0A0C2V4Y7_PARME|nr:30S ribosomal protein S12 methylthiotransferase RimO [Paramagnetospirillum magnetotacticum]KIM00117.1 Ribosomal protein S12p Asp88 methylthiotransferase [Paramagnetospirillum magnetotacticum MS-1]
MSLTQPKVGIVSLGCSKALVDSERILTKLRAEGYDISGSYDGADVVIVNTCGFLDSARAESLEAIGEALAENGKVIVTGCMGGDEKAIRGAHPSVLAVSGPHQYQAVVEAVHAAIPPLHDPKLSLVPPEGLHLTPHHYAYLKISEGCNNSCSFCIIPDIRGPLVSRSAADVLGEAERLAESGVRELLVISQDTSAYGLDLRHAESSWRGRPVRAHLTDLARALGELGIWIRMHYVYPYPHVDEIIPLMAEGKILPYLDIPFQHASPNVLKAMRRPANQEKVLGRIRSWRETCPDLTLRSTFIVGFPGETDDDFESLLEWMDEAQLDRVGCFKYEDVKGAPSNAFADQVDEDVKEERHQRFMEAARQIADERGAAKEGTRVEVIIDEVDEEGAIGRSKADSPEVDGAVFMNGETDLEPGDLVIVEVEAAEDYDLWGDVVERLPPPRPRR